MLITIVMPCLNEEAAIGRTIDEIPFDTLKEMSYEIEILVIDGGSSDASVDLARSRGAKVLLSEKGYGKQCRLGLDHAGGDIVITADSDATSPSHHVRIPVHHPYPPLSVLRYSSRFSCRCRSVFPSR